jgi:hypothetical protein
VIDLLNLLSKTERGKLISAVKPAEKATGIFDRIALHNG